MKLAFLRSWEFCWYWLPPLAWCGAVLAMSGNLGAGANTLSVLKWLLSWFPPLSPGQLNLLHFYLRKTGHFVAYGLLYFLWFRAFRGNLGWRHGRAFFPSIIFCLVVALLDEGHQSLFISRGSSLRDVALDLSGASSVALVTWILGPLKVKPAAEK